MDWALPVGRDSEHEDIRRPRGKAMWQGTVGSL